MMLTHWCNLLTICNYKKAVGYLIIGTTIAITLGLWLYTLSDVTIFWSDPFLCASKITILAGTIAMCWTFFLATRLPIFNTMLGGLDKVYHIHKTMGKLSYSCVILHILFQCLRHFPDMQAMAQLFIPPEVGGLAFGIAAFILFTLLLAFTLWIPIPYHIWKRTHELFIVVLLLSFLHMYFINKHINASSVLSLWIYGWIALAAISYVYIRFLYYYIGPRYPYTITEIHSLRSNSTNANNTQTWNITLAADHKKMAYQPGQFIYVSFVSRSVTPEVHPYSISSYPSQKDIRLSIKSLGDHTQTLSSLNSGDTALLWGPYGKFYEPYLYQENRDAVMIAGGIGITPFLSLLGYEAHNPHNRKTFIFYCPLFLLVSTRGLCPIDWQPREKNT